LGTSNYFRNGYSYKLQIWPVHSQGPVRPNKNTDGQTDGQTDDMQSQYRALHYNASRGKNDDNRYILAKVIVKIKKKLHLAYYI